MTIKIQRGQIRKIYHTWFIPEPENKKGHFKNEPQSMLRQLAKWLDKNHNVFIENIEYNLSGSGSLHIYYSILGDTNTLIATFGKDSKKGTN